MKNEMNLTMLTDFYEFTMMNGFFAEGYKDKIAYFDMFFRRVPEDGGFAIMAGVEQIIEYIKEINFTAEDIEYLRSKGIFKEEFLKYLENFKFECDVWAVPDGTPIFPGEPIITVRGPVIQAQFVETMILLTINHQSLIATKANRIVRAAQGRAVMEFGSRRAQGYSAATIGARAAYIGGVAGTLVLFPMNFTECRRSEQWHIVGYSFLTVNMRRSMRMRRIIRQAVLYLLILIMC